MNPKPILAALFSLTLVCGWAGLAVAASNASTSGGLTLEQAVGARAQGMGEAFTGIADDATGLFWNVGSLSQLPGTQLNASYVAGLADSANEQLYYTQALGQNSGLGLGLVFFQGGTVTLDEPGGDKTVQSQSDMALDLGYGYKILKNLGLGVGLKFLQSTLAEEVTAETLAADAGLLLAMDKQLSVGLTVQNMGPGLKYVSETDPLPLTVRLGAGYKLPIAKDHEGLVGVDLVKVNDQDLGLNVGAEYWFARLLALRVGYLTGTDLAGLTAGLGFRWQVFEFDYAFGLMQELNNTNKVSLAMNW